MRLLDKINIECIVQGENFKLPKYSSRIGGQVYENKDQAELLKMFNSRNNTTCKVLLFDGYISEGLNFIGINHMYIARPYSSVDRFMQAYGRINRLCDNTSKESKNNIHIVAMNGKSIGDWLEIFEKTKTLMKIYNQLLNNSFDNAFYTDLNNSLTFSVKGNPKIVDIKKD